MDTLIESIKEQSDNFVDGLALCKAMSGDAELLDKMVELAQQLNEDVNTLVEVSG